MMPTGQSSLCAPGQEFAHLLTIEIYDLAGLPMETQAHLLEVLPCRLEQISTVREAFRRHTMAEMWNDRGVLLAFFGDPSQPAQCAKDLAELLQGEDSVPFRMGIHSGVTFRETDAEGQIRLFGEGVLLVRRVLECGEKGNILLSQDFVDRLLSQKGWAAYWKQHLATAGGWTNDYGQELTLYNLYGDKYGRKDRLRRITGELSEQVMAHILFMDVAGSSKFHGEEQLKMYNELQELVRATAEYQRALKDNGVICRPLGDGMLVIFFDQMMSPIRCGLEITRAKSQYRYYMGIHSGFVSRVTDINGHADVSGDEVIIARRVQEACDAGHILVSDYVGRTLSTTLPWSGWLRYLGVAYDKHKNPVEVYNLVTPDAGNKLRPTRMRGDSGELPSLPPKSARAAGSLTVLNEDKLPDLSLEARREKAAQRPAEMHRKPRRHWRWQSAVLTLIFLSLFGSGIYYARGHDVIQFIATSLFTDDDFHPRKHSSSLLNKQYPLLTPYAEVHSKIGQLSQDRTHKPHVIQPPTVEETRDKQVHRKSDANQGHLGAKTAPSVMTISLSRPTAGSKVMLHLRMQKDGRGLRQVTIYTHEKGADSELLDIPNATDGTSEEFAIELDSDNPALSIKVNDNWIAQNVHVPLKDHPVQEIHYTLMPTDNDDKNPETPPKKTQPTEEEQDPTDEKDSHDLPEQYTNP